MRIIGIKVFLIFVLSCSKEKPGNVPEYIGEIDNLTVYSVEDKSRYQMQVRREQTYGDSDDIYIGNIVDLTIDDNGRVFVADGGELDIKVFTHDGDFLKRIGRRGEGPGEFLELSSLHMNENELIAYDRNQQNAVKFSLDSLDNHQTIDLADNRNKFDNLDGLYNGNLIARRSGDFLMKFIKPESTESARDWDTIKNFGFYHLLDKDGRIVSDSLIELTSTIEVLIPRGALSVGMPVEFYAKSLTALSNDDHIYLTWTEDILTKVYKPNGTYKRAFYYPFENVALTRETAASANIPELVIDGMPSMDLPQFWPAMDELLIDDENRLWISTIVEDFDVYEWWVLETSGEMLTRFEWPRDEPIEAVRNGFMYTRETDEETGIQIIVRYLIEMEAT